MSAHARLAPDEQMTMEEFLAFTDSRPDGERWELIEGAAVMSPPPVDNHQMVVANLVAYFVAHKRETGASWYPMPGIGTRVPVSPRSLPQPDVFIKEQPTADSPTTDDAMVVFEVLSRSSTKADQAWRRKVYASVPNCQHYVTVSLKTVEMLAYDRIASWSKRAATRLSDSLDLPAIGVSMPLIDIYRWTPLCNDPG